MTTGGNEPAETVFEISNVRCPNGHAWDITYVRRGHADISHFPYYNYIHEGGSKEGIQRSMRGVSRGHSSRDLREVSHEGRGFKEGLNREGLKRDGPKKRHESQKGESQGTQEGSRWSPKGRGYPGELRNPADIKIFNSDIWNVRRTSDMTDIEHALPPPVYLTFKSFDPWLFSIKKIKNVLSKIDYSIDLSFWFCELTSFRRIIFYLRIPIGLSLYVIDT